MAKGAIAKKEIFDKILETFDGSFMWNNGKELRIPFDEEGNLVQIKVALTCAKENVYPEGVPEKDAAAASQSDPIPAIPEDPVLAEPTPEEKQNVEDLLKSLGLV